MSAVYTSGLGTYLWDGVSHSQAGQASAIGSVGSTSSAHSGGAGIDIANISERAQLFSGLEALSATRPAQFQKNTGAIAQYLRSAAGNVDDTDESSFLTRTASTFEHASQTGHFSDLFLNEGHGSSLEEPEPYIVSQIFSHVLPQVLDDVQKGSIAK